MGDRRTRLAQVFGGQDGDFAQGAQNQVRGPAQTEARPPLGHHVHTLDVFQHGVPERLAAARAQERLESGLDIKAGHHAIVVPACVPAQLDRDALAVGRDLPALGQPRPILVLPALDQCFINQVVYHALDDLKLVLQRVEVRRLGLEVDTERPAVGIRPGGLGGDLG